MKRKAKYKIFTTQREMMYVGDQIDHTLMLTAMEGEPIEYEKGVAGRIHFPAQCGLSMTAPKAQAPCRAMPSRLLKRVRFTAATKVKEMPAPK